ncbi:MAG: DUF3459 domain-containing protein, partial [Opitutaceae bacterium]
PGDRQTFLRCKLNLDERQSNQASYRLHQDLLRVRREDETINTPSRLDGAVLSEQAFVLRFFAAHGDDRILVVNLGVDLWYNPAPEPLLAPLYEHGWAIQWSSESPDYGGSGTAPLETNANWIVPGESAVLLRPHENGELSDAPVSQKN